MNTLYSSQRLLDPSTCERWGLTRQRFEELTASIAKAALLEGLEATINGRTAPFPMIPSIVQLDEEAELRLARHVPQIYNALLKIVRAHRADPRLRAYLNVPQALLPWADASPPEHDVIDFCRIDFVGDASAKIVEFNANCPGGTIFTSAYGRLWEEQPEVAKILGNWGTRTTEMSRRHWFPDFLESRFGGDGGSLGARDRIAIFHKPGGNTLELEKMTLLLAEKERQAFLAAPSAPDLREVSYGYLKYSVQATLADIDGWRKFLASVIAGDLTIINPLPGRWIGDNKLCLAVMSDPRFSYLFISSELEAIRQLIPFSRKVGDGVEPQELLREPRSWVLKGPYDTRANSVFLGQEQDAGQWKALVATAASQGWLAQEMIPPGVRIWQKEQRFQDLSIVLLNGRCAGCISRVSQNLRVNVAQGGATQIVLGNADAGWPEGSL